VRTLFTARWLGLLACALALAAGMVFLGKWQLSRYEARDAINTRIDASATGQAGPLADVLARPSGGAGSVGPAPADNAQWRRVTVKGVYAADHQVLVRNRTVNSSFGFEVLTPLVLTDGSAILIDRGWVEPAAAGLTTAPSVPAPPSGEVTVTGRVHLTESGAGAPEQISGVAQVRRVGVPEIAATMPYPVWNAYLLAIDGTPGATSQTIPVVRENSWQNAAYVVNWWLFAVLTLVGYGYLLRKEITEGRAPSPAVEDSETAAVG